MEPERQRQMEPELVSEIAVIGGSGYIGSYLCKYLPACPDPLDTSKFKVVIYLAGVSKRYACNDSWENTYSKNVTQVVNFAKKLEPERQLFIYASTGAICCGQTSLDNYTKSMLLREREISKLPIRSIGLRIAGVVGRTPNMRMDLIYHAMLQTALRGKTIQVQNPNTSRGVLWINDLLEAIRCIVNCKVPRESRHEIFELCSFNTTVLDIARDISQATCIPFKSFETGNPVPGFKLESTEFSRVFGFTFKGTRENVIEDLLGVGEGTLTPLA